MLQKCFNDKQDMSIMDNERIQDAGITILAFCPDYNSLSRLLVFISPLAFHRNSVIRNPDFVCARASWFEAHVIHTRSIFTHFTGKTETIIRHIRCHGPVSYFRAISCRETEKKNDFSHKYQVHKSQVMLEVS